MHIRWILCTRINFYGLMFGMYVLWVQEVFCIVYIETRFIEMDKTS